LASIRRLPDFLRRFVRADYVESVMRELISGTAYGVLFVGAIVVILFS
jgi:hypothetical protein